MIYTVTLNPGIDYNVFPYTMETGKTNRCHDEYIVPGGKGLNVSVMLSRFGLESTAFGFVSGFTGQELIRMMEAEHVPCDFVDVEEGFTRINVKICADKVTEYNGAGICLKEEHVQALEEKISALGPDDVLVMSGSIPKGGNADLYQRLMAKMKGRKVLDSNGEPLLRGLSEHPFLIKPNDEEIAAFADGPVTCREDQVRAARKLQEMGAANVLVSLGGDGAFLITESGECFSEPAPKAPEGRTLNTVAAGDTMLSAFLFKYFETGDPERSLKFSVAAGTAAAYSPWLPEVAFVKELAGEQA